MGERNVWGSGLWSLPARSASDEPKSLEVVLGPKVIVEIEIIELHERKYTPRR